MIASPMPLPAVAGLLCLAVVGACAAAGEKFGPPAEGKWAAFAPMTDEFEGDKLDAAKWYDHNPTWKGRQPAFFAKHNVTVSDGKLHLTMRAEDLKGLPAGYHTFTSAAVKSKAAVRYGYFEIKCKPMDSHGSSAFWFYAQTPEIWTEIDVFEMGAGAPKHERIVHMNAHVFHTLTNPDGHWSKGGKWTSPWRLADGYHVYALQWDESKLKYYVDGRVVRETANTHWHQPLHLNFDSETMPNWFGLPDKKDLPSTFSIEYVRAWKRTDAPAASRPRSVEFTFSKAEAAAAKGKTVTYRLNAAEGGHVLVIAKHGGSPRPDRVHLEYDEPKFYAAQTAATAARTVHVTDGGGKAAAFAFTWSKVKGHAGHNGYRGDWVDVTPAARPKEGRDVPYEFVSESGKQVRMVIAY